MGVAGIHNILNNRNKNNLIDNVICIINGIFRGNYCGLQSRKRRYHERWIDADVVSAAFRFLVSNRRKKGISDTGWESEFAC